MAVDAQGAVRLQPQARPVPPGTMNKIGERAASRQGGQPGGHADRLGPGPLGRAVRFNRDLDAEAALAPAADKARVERRGGRNAQKTTLDTADPRPNLVFAERAELDVEIGLFSSSRSLHTSYWRDWSVCSSD